MIRKNGFILRPLIFRSIIAETSKLAVRVSIELSNYCSKCGFLTCFASEKIGVTNPIKIFWSSTFKANISKNNNTETWKLSVNVDLNLVKIYAK